MNRIYNMDKMNNLFYRIKWILYKRTYKKILKRERI